MSQRNIKLLKRFSKELDQKKTKLFLMGLTELPRPQRMWLGFRVFWGIKLYHATKKEKEEIAGGRFLK